MAVPGFRRFEPKTRLRKTNIRFEPLTQPEASLYQGSLVKMSTCKKDIENLSPALTIKKRKAIFDPPHNVFELNTGTYGPGQFVL